MDILERIQLRARKIMKVLEDLSNEERLREVDCSALKRKGLESISQCINI